MVVLTPGRERDFVVQEIQCSSRPAGLLQNGVDAPFGLEALEVLARPPPLLVVVQLEYVVPLRREGVGKCEPALLDHLAADPFARAGLDRGAVALGAASDRIQGEERPHQTRES